MTCFNLFRDQLFLHRNSFVSDNYTLNLTEYGITKTYFNRITKAVDLLADFNQTELISHRFFNSFSEKINNFEEEDSKLCVLIDVVRCYDGLNHPTALTTPEGFALMLLINKFYEFGNIEFYENLYAVNSSIISIIDLVPYIAECSYALGETQTLFVSSILQKYDKDIDNRYRLLIYNLCKKIAEVDNYISIEEKEWLEEIARLDDDDITNDLDVSLFTE